MQRAACAHGTARASRRGETRRRAVRGTPPPCTRARATDCRSVSRARRREREEVRGADVDEPRPARAATRSARAAAAGCSTCSIVCRKTIASHGAPSSNCSTSARSKRRFAAPVPAAGVLVRLGVGVHADDLAPHARRARPTRSPRRRPCRRRAGRRSARRSSGRRPGGGGTSSSPRERRAASARRSARAAARPAAGRAEGRLVNMRRCTAICRGARDAPPAASPTAAPTRRSRKSNVRYHDAAADGYDSKWAIDYGEIGAGQVLGKLDEGARRARPAAIARALEIGAGTGYFTLNLLRPGVIGEATATDISHGMLRRCPRRRAASASRSRRSRPTPSASLR